MKHIPPCIIGTAALSLIWPVATAQSLSPKPNVLFIAIDDLNDWIGCYKGHPQAVTPNIDRLAQQGMLFANAHCQAPICMPSRASLLTGMYPFHTGVYLLEPSDVRQIPTIADLVLLPQYFANHGYKTLGVGKILHHSFDGFFQESGGNPGAGPVRPQDKKLSYPLGHPLWDWGAFPEHDSLMPDYQSVDWAVRQLQKQDTTPFFLAVGFNRPHVPMYAPAHWFDLYPLENLMLPTILPTDTDDISAYALDLTFAASAPRHKWMVENNQWAHAVQSYLACVSFVDYYVGRLLLALEQNGLAQNTIVVLWGDHGFHLGEKLRWGKRSLWEETTRVPLIIAGPGIAQQAECNRPVELVDLYPTLIELCGLPPKTDLDGQSLAPLLHNPQSEWNYPAITSFGPDNHSVRTSTHRLIRYGDGSLELYDLANDPAEWYNLSGQAENKKTIRKLLRWLPSRPAPLVPGSKYSDSKTVYD